jgi:hypothetical protein
MSRPIDPRTLQGRYVGALEERKQAVVWCKRFTAWKVSRAPGRAWPWSKTRIGDSRACP